MTKTATKRISEALGNTADEQINTYVSPAAKADTSYKGADRRKMERDKGKAVVKQLQETWSPKAQKTNF